METVALDVFQKSLNQYVDYFNELHSDLTKKEALPEINEIIKELQLAFCDLPENLQKRLLELNFNIFISYDSDPDFYTYIKFVRQKCLFTRIHTLRARINAEVNLAREFIERDKLDKYGYLPSREFDSWKKLLHLNDDQMPISEDK